MDVVYIIDQTRPINTDALKYSIRALQKNMSDLGSIYIVGPRQKAAPLAKYLDFKPEHEKDWQNQLAAILCACNDVQLTDEFLLVDIKTIMLQPFIGDDYPFYRTKSGDGGPNGMYNFDLTCPVRLNKNWVSQLPITPKTKGDYNPRTFYCNYFRAPSYPADNVYLRYGNDMPTISEQLCNKPWFALKNNCLPDPEITWWLAHRFPDPSTTE